MPYDEQDVIRGKHTGHSRHGPCRCFLGFSLTHFDDLIADHAPDTSEAVYLFQATARAFVTVIVRYSGLKAEGDSISVMVGYHPNLWMPNLHLRVAVVFLVALAQALAQE